VEQICSHETWTRKTISRDLRLENNNFVAKEEIKALGFPNINSGSIIKTTKSGLEIATNTVAFET